MSLWWKDMLHFFTVYEVSRSERNKLTKFKVDDAWDEGEEMSIGNRIYHKDVDDKY